MSSVAAAFARALVSAAGLTITEGCVVRSGAEIVHRFSRLPDDRLPSAEQFELIEWIRAHHPDRIELVFAYARTVDIDHLGVLGLAVKTAPTLRGSLRCIERYFRLVADSALYRLQERPDGGAAFSIEPLTDPHPALSLRNECALAGFARAMRGWAGEGLAIDHVAFRHEAPADPARYAAQFGCPVRFDAPRDAILLAPFALDMPNRLSDRALSCYLSAHLDAGLSRLDQAAIPDAPATPSLETRLLAWLTERLGAGAPSAAQAARDLGMSERTLYRRLGALGLTYRDVLQDAQTRLARRLLSERAHSIAEIAFLTGFSEQSAFTRAFKRQVGRTPAQFRQQGTPA